MAKQPTPLTRGLGQALAAVGRSIDALPARGMLIGGIAAIARGVPRATRDVDFTVSGGHTTIAQTIEVLAEFGLAPRIPDAERFAEANQVLMLKHEPTGVEVDLSIAWLSFEEEAIASAELMNLGEVRVPVARPEDLIIYKTVAWRPQDQQDVERLIALHRDTIDRDRVLPTVRELCEALDEPERVSAIERMFTSAGD